MPTWTRPSSSPEAVRHVADMAFPSRSRLSSAALLQNADCRLWGRHMSRTKSGANCTGYRTYSGGDALRRPQAACLSGGPQVAPCGGSALRADAPVRPGRARRMPRPIAGRATAAASHRNRCHSPKSTRPTRAETVSRGRAMRLQASQRTISCSSVKAQ